MIHDQLNPPATRRPAIEPALPLINVVFLLLIFFMMAGQVAPDHPVATPESDAADMDEDPRLRTLVLQRDGTLTSEGEPLALDELGHWYRQAPKRPLRILADSNLTLEELRPVLGMLRQAGADEARLITRRPE